MTTCDRLALAVLLCGVAVILWALDDMNLQLLRLTILTREARRPVSTGQRE